MKLLFRLLTLLFFTLATLSANAQRPSSRPTPRS